MGEFTGKSAVITGGGSGIGRSLVLELATQGCNVMVADVRKESAETVVDALASDGVKAVATACDVTDYAQLEALADAAWSEFGAIDMVFCNAGVMPGPGPFVEADEASGRWVFEVNYFGTRNTAQVFSRRLIAQGTPANLVLTGSENSLCVPAPLMCDYNASKHAVLGMSEMIRSEMPDFITVSVICPGMVKTGLSSSVELRPDKFGGPGEDPFGGEMPAGMDSDTVARHAVEEIKKGTFYILTHHCVRYMVVERYEELIGAFDDQASPDDGSDAFDTRKLVAAILEQGGL
jgi:NAD(P)-dependent dehydrogenase (short-subunit alcohol dehydrogenase family)